MTKRDEIAEVIEQGTYTYQDMLSAFKAGKRHEHECGNTNNDCWDFVGWLKSIVKADDTVDENKCMNVYHHEMKERGLIETNCPFCEAEQDEGK